MTQVQTPWLTQLRSKEVLPQLGEDHELDKPADQAHSHGALEALVVECLPNRDDHGQEDPGAHGDHGQKPQSGNKSQHPEQTGRGSKASGAHQFANV